MSLTGENEIEELPKGKKRCYAGVIGSGEKLTAVLGISQIVSPETTIRASIIADARQSG